MTIGERIAQSRRGCNLTQDQLAEVLGVSRQMVSKWELSLAFPETVKISKLAEVLGVSCDYLLSEKADALHSVPIMGSETGYAVDWSKLYPVLATYQEVVDRGRYKAALEGLIEELMATYHYSLEDGMLVLKDLLYKTYLELEEKQSAK